MATFVTTFIVSPSSSQPIWLLQERGRACLVWRRTTSVNVRKRDFSIYWLDITVCLLERSGLPVPAGTPGTAGLV